MQVNRSLTVTLGVTKDEHDISNLGRRLLNAYLIVVVEDNLGRPFI
jgi:hypothetical protein